jgi:phosphatidylserine/phosphatidylglycerophosphate/cardiolipin synthase-like enzyme
MPLTVKNYVSDGSVLLAFDMPQPGDDFAGFAIQCTPKGGQPYFLQNRLSLTQGVHSDTPAGQMPWTTSDKAPFQKFYWMHFPETVDQIKQYDYEITAMYFQGGSQDLKKGDSARTSADFTTFGSQYANFTPGFTRGYLSSQAYATKFKNAPIRPVSKTKQMDYDTKPFAPQYEWLGYSARKLVFNMLNEALQDKTIHIDLFAYDLDEPDFIKGIVQLGKEGRLRAFLDNASLHTKKGAVEIDAHKAILAAAGEQNVVQGCFKRFAHCKVMVARRNGAPFKVFTGSANFSVRGLYVQANNCFVINDPKAAGGYGQAFDVAFTQQQQLKSSGKVATAFAKSPIAAGYLDCSGPNLPKFKVAFSPHTSAEVSLGVVSDAIKNAKSSVIFSVMQLGGGGDVMSGLNTLNQRPDIFAYGMTQSAGGVKLFAPGSAQHGAFAAFSYLKGKVPPPFDAEYSGGGGIVIHDKFVVVDFNGDNPAVFTGSSNLAGGGEEANGDSLLAIYDSNLARGFAVEGIRLVDHYHFRMMEAQHPSSDAITLQGPDGQAKKWWAPYYDKADNKYAERVLFSQGHQALVAQVATGTTGASTVVGKAAPATGSATPSIPIPPPVTTSTTTPPAQKPSKGTKSGGGAKKTGGKKKAGSAKKAGAGKKSTKGGKKTGGRKKTTGKKASAGRKTTAAKRRSTTKKSSKKGAGAKKSRGKKGRKTSKSSRSPRKKK